MTQNPITEAIRNADSLRPAMRYWIKQGLIFGTPMSGISTLLGCNVVDVRDVLIADKEELGQEVWDNYRMEICS